MRRGVLLQLVVMMVVVLFFDGVGVGFLFFSARCCTLAKTSKIPQQRRNTRRKYANPTPILLVVYLSSKIPGVKE